MINPFYDAYETSLSKLDDGEWSQVSCRWSRGIDWNVHKVGKRHWEVAGRLGQGVRLFKTKTAAYEYGSNLILAESHWRGHQKWEREHQDETPQQ